MRNSILPSFSLGMDWSSGNPWYHFLFLLEASGDSEGNFNCLENYETNLCGTSNPMLMNFLGGLPLACDQDDAESSSCDDSSYMLMINSNEIRDFDNVQDFGDSNDGVDDSPEGLISSEVVIEESRLGTFIESINRELDNGIDGDRLFWETCLAAGFP